MIRTLGASRTILVCVALLLLAAAAGPVQAADPADWPRIIQRLDFGVPAGNGDYPYQIAVDAARSRAYTLNMGSNASGNSISVFDTRRNEIVALIPFDNPGEFSPPAPVDLVVDPYRSRLYALTGDRYADTPATDLYVVDSDRLEVVATLTDVEAVAPGPESLYLANDTRLWTIDPDTLAEQERQDLPSRKFNEPLLLNPDMERLYLARSDWSGEGDAELVIYDATDLSEIDSVPFEARPDSIILHTPSGRLFVVEKGDGRATVVALDADGRRLETPRPVEMTGEYLYQFPIAAGDEVVYLGGGSYENYRMRAYRLPDLQPLGQQFTIRHPNEIALDPVTGRLYAQYTSFGGPVLTIEPGSGAIRTTYTALSVRDALADPESGRLYVLDDAGTLRILARAGSDGSRYLQQARVDTGFSLFPNNWGSYGQLSLDPGRGRLYIDGLPARSVDVATLAVTVYPDVAGQLTPDPTSDRVYLTPPCRCRTEQCNTLILSAETMTGTQTLFPPEEPMTAQCVFETVLDTTNRLLYARIDNGVPGSNSGAYFSVFDVADTPELLHTAWEISFSRPALDRPARRAYLSRYRMDRSFIHRFDSVGRTFTDTLVLAGAGGQLAFDETRRRLYSAANDSLQVFDADLTLLADVGLPAGYTLLDSNVVDGHLHLAGPDGEMLIVATSGGRPQSPPPAAPRRSDAVAGQQLVAAPDGTLFRAFADRLYRSDDGQDWDLLGTGLPARPVCAIAISPDFASDQTLFAALMGYGRNGGLYRSTDGGDTWAPAMRGLTDTEMCTLGISPTFGRDRTLFAASYFRGLFRSTDGGDSWTWLADRYAPPDSRELDVSHIALSPTYADDGLILIVRGNVLRSTDGGETWQDTGVPGGRLAFSPDFARDRLILSGGNWRSTDGGRSWVPSAAGLEQTDYGARSIIFSPQFAADQTIYILVDRGYDGLPPLQRSVDGGRSWLTLRGGLPDGFQFSAVAMLPSGELVFGGLDGQTVRVPPERLLWSRATPLTDAITELDIQDIAALPDGTLLIGHYALGVLRSGDGGRTWAVDSFPVRAGSSAEVRLAVADDGTVFAALGNAIERSADGGRTWEHLGSVPTGFRATALAVAPDFSTSGVVMAGGDYNRRQLIRSADRGATWQVVYDASGIETASGIAAIAFSPHVGRDGSVYAWLQDGGLLASSDGGFTWTLRATEQKGYYAQSLTMTPDGGRLILGPLYGNVLISDDRGYTWTDVGERIPGERVWSTDLVFDPTGMLYLSTDRGVYRSPDAGDSWQPASAGLPIDPREQKPQSVRALATAGGVLYAALYQGGVFASADQGQTWRSTLTGEPASPIEATAFPTPVPPPPTATLPPPPTATLPPTPAGPATPSDCPAQPAFFADLWAARVARLGCPIGAWKTSIVEESFERGWMFWRSDTREIYALAYGWPYARFADTWEESQPEYTCPDTYPRQTPPTPKRGFGKVWCNPDNAYVRDRLGNATGEERAFEASVQAFDRGLIFSTDRGAIYILPWATEAWEEIR